MIIPKKVEKALNAHLELEASAFFSYLAVAAWCEKEGLKAAQNFSANNPMKSMCIL